MRDFLRNPKPLRPEHAPEIGTFEERLIRCQPELLRYAKSVAKNIALARDLVQETYLRALERHKEDPQEIKSMIAWTTTILQRLYLGHKKRAYVQKEVGGEEAEEAFETAESPEPELGDTLHDIRTRNKMYDTIDTLSKQQYEVITGRLRGESYKRIARKIGVSPKTVEEHLDRAQKTLKRKMGE